MAEVYLLCTHEIPPPGLSHRKDRVWELVPQDFIYLAYLVLNLNPWPRGTRLITSLMRPCQTHACLKVILVLMLMIILWYDSCALEGARLMSCVSDFHTDLEAPSLEPER